jgi:hypothetical protein
MTTKANKSGFYLFEKFKIEVLLKRTHYSRIYLEEIKSGKQEARRQFRKVVAKELGIPEEKLFSMEVRNVD